MLGGKVVELGIFNGSKSLLFGEREGKSEAEDEKCKEGRMDGDEPGDKVSSRVFPLERTDF